MYLVSNIKNVFVLTAVLFFFSACSGGGGSASSSDTNSNGDSTTTSTGSTVSTSTPTTESPAPEPAPETPAPMPEPVPETPAPATETPVPAPAAKAVHQGQVMDSHSGNGLANVKVSIGEHTVTTDAQGFYELTDIDVNDRAVVTFKHEGYYTHSKIISIKQYSYGTTLSPNYLDFALDKYDAQHNDDSQNEKWWRYSFGIKIPGGIYTDNEGNDYGGNAIASVAYEDVSTDKGRDAFPGAYEGKNSNDVIVPFVSYGFMVIDLKDENGAELGTSDDISLTFHSAEGATSESIPLWYYDYAQGIWIEEGYATRLPDGKYEGTVSHPGTWSLSQPIENDPGTYTDRIVYPDGTPVKNLRVHAIGKNWIRTDLYTDENGVLEIEVIPGEEFGLKVYHSSNKYGAKFNGQIAAVASGEIVDNIE